jgi:hypothetical protein
MPRARKRSADIQRLEYGQEDATIDALAEDLHALLRYSFMRCCRGCASSMANRRRVTR